MGDVGGGEYDDVMTGVDHLIAERQVDPDRLGLRGWSWGGILGSWVITQTDRFKAASLGAMVGSWTAETGPGLSYDLRLHYIGGAHWTNPEEWRRASSLWYVKDVTTATLLLHGERDLVSTPQQSMLFFTALKDIGKAPVRYVSFPREPHGFREPRHQRRRDIEEIMWMQKHVMGIEWKPWETITTRNPINGRRAPGSTPPRTAARIFCSGSPKCPPRMTHSASASRSSRSSVGSYGYGWYGLRVSSQTLPLMSNRPKAHSGQRKLPTGAVAMPA